MIFKKDSLPLGAKKLGSVKELNWLREDCDYSQTLEAICIQAYQRGGNAVVITRMKQPGVMATCFKIWADVYTIPITNEEENNKRRTAIYDSLMHTLVPEDANYSLLYAYRANSYENTGDFNLYMNNKMIASLSVASLSMDDKYVIKITKPGMVTLGTRGLSFEQMEKLNVEMGKVYFLRCDIYVDRKVAYPVDRRVAYPTLELVIPSKGFYDIGFKNLQQMAAGINNKG